MCSGTTRGGKGTREHHVTDKVVDKGEGAGRVVARDGNKGLQVARTVDLHATGACDQQEVGGEKERLTLGHLVSRYAITDD